MERARIKTASEVERFRALAAKAYEISVANIKREVDYNDAPDEFRGKFSPHVIIFSLLYIV